jgi:hypothetical protein
MHGAGGQALQSWVEFKAEFRHVYGPQAEVEKATEILLGRLSQGNRKIDEFLNYVDQLNLKANIPPAQLRYLVDRALEPGFQKDVSLQLYPPEDLAQWFGWIRDLGRKRELRKIQEEEWAKTRNPGGQKRKAENPSDDAPKPKRDKPSGKGKGNNNKPKANPKHTTKDGEKKEPTWKDDLGVTKEERDKAVKEGNCLRCLRPGHYGKDCFAKYKATAAKVAAMKRDWKQGDKKNESKPKPKPQRKVAGAAAEPEPESGEFEDSMEVDY